MAAKEAGIFKLELLDKLSDKQAEMKITLMHNEDPYEKLRLSNQLEGLRMAIEIAQEMPSFQQTVIV